MTAMLFSLAVGLNTVSMAAKADAPKEQETDVLLIGGGIMSATLGTYLQELQPDWSMTWSSALMAWRRRVRTDGITPVPAIRHSWN